MTNTRKVSLGRQVRAQRARKGLTQAEAAEAVGVDPRTLRQWERGKSNPRASSLDGIATFLGVDVLDLEGAL